MTSGSLDELKTAAEATRSAAARPSETPPYMTTAKAELLLGWVARALGLIARARS